MYVLTCLPSFIFLRPTEAAPDGEPVLWHISYSCGITVCILHTVHTIFPLFVVKIFLI